MSAAAEPRRCRIDIGVTIREIERVKANVVLLENPATGNDLKPRTACVLIK